MKLNGSNNQRLPEPHLSAKSPARAPKTTKSSEVPTNSETTIDPLKSSFQHLADKGLRAPLGEEVRLRQNLKKGYEALVQFKDAEDKPVILAVRKEKEVPLYAALKTGGEVGSELKTLYQDLKAAGEKKSNFFLERQEQHLPTDAAGAAISLQRNSRVVIQRNDGQYETHNSPEKALEFLTGSDAKAAKAQDEVNKAQEAGLTLTPISADDETMDKTSMIMSMLGGGDSELEIDKQLAESLAEHGKVEATFENDERPIALPVTLTTDELSLASEWSNGPTAEIKKFQSDFKALTDDKAILMTQQASGQMKGMVVRADDRAAYFQLRHGERVVALDKNGALHELKNLGDFQKFKEEGRVHAPVAQPFDGEKTNSDNLLMFYHVSPFDPIEKGNYDDLPQRITAVGSSEQVDIVTMRSDLPTKRNLLVERAQKGEQQEIARLDADVAMNQPKVLEDFVYQTVKSNLGDGKIRFLVGGHGGAEKGLLPDGEHNNAEADHAMQVDKFAGAISKALDRVEKETGERPKIDNLMLVSCLMGNTSFIHALAQTGDIETLVASPELMAGSNPLSTFEYLADPKTSKASGREYAQHLVDEWSQAPAMIGGSKDHLHADTIGAYDLSPDKAKRFQKALGGFFEAALAEPKYAEYLKEGIAKAPSYGINPLINIMFDVDNRDLLQVLDRTSQDARITSPKLKKAIAELMEATEAQVIEQKVSENYEGRRGPSLYLPLEKWDMNEKMVQTGLLKSVKYKEFMDMIFDAPLQRGVVSNLINEVSRISETGALDGAFKKMTDAATGKSEKAEEEKVVEALEKKPIEVEIKKPELSDVKKAELEESSTEPVKLDEESQKTLESFFDLLGNMGSPEAQELTELRELEQDTAVRPLRKVLGFAKGAAKLAVGVGLGAVGGAIAAVPAFLVGTVTGARAGWTGTSAAGTAKPSNKEETETVANAIGELLGEEVSSSEADTTDAELAPLEAGELDFDKESIDLSPLKGLLKGRVAKGIKQALLWPSEALAIGTHEKVGFKLGEYPGRIAGALVGAVTGGLTNALALGGVAFAGAGFLAGAGTGAVLDKVTPGPAKKGDDLFIGRYEQSEEAKTETEA